MKMNRCDELNYEGIWLFLLMMICFVGLLM